MTQTVLCVFPLPDHYRSLIEPHAAGYKVLTAETMEEAMELVPEADALVSLSVVSPALIERGKKLKWVQTLLSGTDMFEAATRNHPEIVLTSMRGIHGPQVSEHAFLLMLALIRKLPFFLRKQQQSTWEKATCSLIQGKTVGIAGYGVIGAELADKCRAFGMKVHAFGSTRREVPGLAGFHLYEELPKIAPQLDFLVMVAPLTPSTERMINASVFNAMKPTAFFINVGRGKTVDEASLMDALTNGKIAGAGLDALPFEPLPSSHPLWQLENVIATPHIAGWHDGYASQTIPTVSRNLELFAQGRMSEMVNIVER